MRYLFHNHEEHFHHATIVFEEDPEDEDAADVMINMEVRDLTLLLAKSEKNCFRQFKQSQNHEEPSCLMNSLHITGWFSFVIGHAIPGVLEAEAISVKLKRKLFSHHDDTNLCKFSTLTPQINRTEQTI